jgi:hypothetical protein
VLVKAVIPSWWMVIRFTGCMRFMLAGIGLPFAQSEREMIPDIWLDEEVAFGRATGVFGVVLDQSTSGNWSCFEPVVVQPARKARDPRMKIRRVVAASNTDTGSPGWSRPVVSSCCAYDPSAA